MRKRSHSRAAPRPSLKAQTTRLWPAPGVAGGKNALEVGGVFLVLGLDVGAGVALDRQLFQQRLFRPQKAHRQKHQLRRARLIGPGHFLGHELPFFVALPFDLHGVDFLDAARGRRR